LGHGEGAFRSSEGWKAASKLSGIFTCISRAVDSATAMRRFSRMLSSSPRSASIASIAPISRPPRASEGWRPHGDLQALHGAVEGLQRARHLETDGVGADPLQHGAHGQAPAARRGPTASWTSSGRCATPPG
ncbi:MAG: hypothetical protein AAGA32_22525, partial [Pseudomonadota bacterium]